MNASKCLFLVQKLTFALKRSRRRQFYVEHKSHLCWAPTPPSTRSTSRSSKTTNIVDTRSWFRMTKKVRRRNWLK